MSLLKKQNAIEILESRIAPAALMNQNFVTATLGGGVLLEAGTTHAGLSTSAGGTGSWMLYVEKGSAMVFTTDLNHNGQLDFNEITGIAASDGLRLTAFCDINGDIVTNLRSNGTLSDSDNNSSNDSDVLKGDGLRLLDSRIEKIELRALTVADLTDQNGDGLVDANDVNLRSVLSSRSIHGNVYAGGGLGIVDDPTSGLLITSAQTGLKAKPSIGAVKVGSAASGEFFRFSTTPTSVTSKNVAGYLSAFVPATGEAGANIYNVSGGTVDAPIAFNLGTLQAGDGGFGAAGGSIGNILIPGDTSGGYKLIAGKGGNGFNGGAGGSIFNLQDLGSVTSDVLIKSGDGGRGLTGAGGNGGNIQAGTFNVSAKLKIQLGSGGDGLTAGGNGAVLSSIKMQIPEGGTPIPTSIKSSMHSVGGIGQSETVDFNGDGIGDFVYTSKDPSQLVVVLGKLNVAGTKLVINESSQRYYLDAQSNATAYTIADVNGDGHPDIVAASSDANGSGVIDVFVSHYSDSDRNGTLDKFDGFDAPRSSMLPSLHSIEGFVDTDFHIYQVVAADLDGDGTLDLGVLTDYKDILGKFENVILTLHGDTQVVRTDGVHSITTGSFSADFGTSGENTPFVLFNSAGDGILKATALAPGQPEALVFAKSGANKMHLIQYVDFGSGKMMEDTIVSLVKVVDANRDTFDDKGKEAVSMVDAPVKDFTFADLDADGNAELVVLSTNNFLVAFTYDSTSFFDPFKIASGEGNQAGIQLVGDKSNAHLSDKIGFQAIVTVTGSATGGDVAIYGPGDGDNPPTVVELDLKHKHWDDRITTEGPFNDAADTDTFLNPSGGTFLNPLAKDTAVFGFDVYRWDANDPSRIGYSHLRPVSDPLYNRGMDFTGDGIGSSLSTFSNPFISASQLGIAIVGGNGGNASVGAGGTGGTIGSGLINGAFSIDIQLPGNIAFGEGDLESGHLGNVELFAGHGGNGFGAGGQGGSVNGFQLTYASGGSLLTSEAAVYAGAGGNSVAGTGGKGGDVMNQHLITGTHLEAGNGGSGKYGGAGGNVVGTGPTIDDILYPDLTVIAGAGGFGTKHGGNGGSILNLKPQLNEYVSGDGGGVTYQAGNGGKSVSGGGGDGGSILNSSPSAILDRVTGVIDLTSGDGGDGLSGGKGGSITNFINSPTQGAVAAQLSVLAGKGGQGISGAGGAGGDITSVSATARAFDGVALVNRVIAGNGGDSFGGVGGAGGTVTSVTSEAVSGAFIAASGKGGSGLTAGGNGGGFLSSSINSAADSTQNPGSEPKVLIVAGAGGDAYAFTKIEGTKQQDAVPTLGTYTPEQQAIALSTLTFGGANGIGGNGGSIRDFTQVGATFTRVDLIAGNGGDTKNYGTAFDDHVNVGKGGSIVNANLEGSIGNSQHDVPIQSYGGAGVNITDFISYAKSSPYITLTDSVGNVGLVAGASGRVYGDDPATAGINGSVSGLSARNIMSMVAGSVDRIAAIQSISGIRFKVSNPTVGADKDVVGHYDYILSDGTPISSTTPTGPDVGGALIDGAIVCSTTPTTIDPVTGMSKTLTGSRVFIL